MTHPTEQLVRIPARLSDALLSIVTLILLLDFACVVGTVGAFVLSWGFHPAAAIAGMLLWTQVLATCLLVAVGYPGSLIAVDFMASCTDEQHTLRVVARGIASAFRAGGFIPVSVAAIVLGCFQSVMRLSNPYLTATVSMAYLILAGWLTWRSVRQLRSRLANDSVPVVSTGPVSPIDPNSPLARDYKHCFGADWLIPMTLRTVDDAVLCARAADVTVRWYRIVRAALALVGAASVLVLTSAFASPDASMPIVSLGIVLVLGSAVTSQVWRGAERFERLANEYRARAAELVREAHGLGAPVTHLRSQTTQG